MVAFGGPWVSWEPLREGRGPKSQVAVGNWEDKVKGKNLVGLNRGIEEVGVEGEHRKGFKRTWGNIEGAKRRKEERHNGKGQALEEPVWGNLKFSKEINGVLNYPQQNHANKKRSRQDPRPYN